jgi:hypothetical protein
MTAAKKKKPSSIRLIHEIATPPFRISGKFYFNGICTALVGLYWASYTMAATQHYSWEDL